MIVLKVGSDPFDSQCGPDGGLQYTLRIIGPFLKPVFVRRELGLRLLNDSLIGEVQNGTITGL